MLTSWIGSLLLGLCGGQATAPTPVSKPPASLSKPKADPAVVLAGHLRKFVVEMLPDPLHVDARNWDRQAKTPRGKMKNDGRWHKLTIWANNPGQSLELDVQYMQRSGKQTAFTVRVRLPARIELQRQTWKYGTRLYSGSTRARVRLELILRCEINTRTETKKGALVPDMILRFRITQSNFRYYDLVVEHTAGIGGDGARLLGEALIGIVKAAKPNLDRDLTAKVNAAVLKAGETKEVRISLTEWLGKAALPGK